MSESRRAWSPERIDRIRDQALQVAHGWSGADAPPSWRLTAEVFHCLAGDQQLLDLAAAIPAERLPPLLFAASVQRAAARHRDEPLAAYYPVPGSEQPEVDERFPEVYRAFCLAHREELADLQRGRVYQMNEVARSAQVALALGVLAQIEPGRQLALVDIGAGGGLGLYLDRYRYLLGDGPRWGPVDSAVEIACEVRGGLRPPAPRLGAIVHRAGCDLNPIDLADPEERAWLLACAPPEAGALRRLSQAMEVARAGGAAVLRGDADLLLTDLVRAAPTGSLVAVVDSYTAVFFDDARLSRLRETISRLGAERDLAWVSLDPLVPLGTRARWTVQGLEPSPDLIEENRRGGVFAALSLQTHLRGRVTTRLLAAAHPSGTRMRWLDPGEGSAGAR